MSETAAEQSQLTQQAGGQQYDYMPTGAQDVVAVFDNNFYQLFPDARSMKATVKEPSKLMSHPTETGVTITDHRVIEPIEIELSVVLLPDTYVQTYYEIKAARDANTTLSVQTNTSLYSSMLIQDMPHEEDPEHFDTITMIIKFIEVIFVTVQVSSLPDSRKNNGNKNGKAASATDGDAGKEKAKGSVAYGAGKRLGLIN